MFAKSYGRSLASAAPLPAASIANKNRRDPPDNGLAELI